MRGTDVSAGEPWGCGGGETAAVCRRGRVTLPRPRWPARLHGPPGSLQWPGTARSPGTVIGIPGLMRARRARLGIALLITAALLVAPSAGMAVDDYPYRGQTGVDPWGFYKGYCTSFVAWRMNQNAGEGSFTNFMDGGRWGDAGNWANNARNLGITVDRTPAVGAIAWWAAGTVSYSGHVA
ncbi:MAG TPA: CHAP domain-containing protein, partial [Actinobacteria bacterium]|nr:CHAP domain-containing protein [Actinomycetota bacterium]